MHRTRRISAALLGSILLACAESPNAATADVVAQRDTAIIELASGCAECTLSISDSIRFGNTTDSVIPLREPDLLRDSRGFYYLLFHDWVNQPILQYDSNGTFVRRIGTLGRGPGEYVMTRATFAGAGDSLYVFSADRVLLVYSPDGEFVRSAVIDGVRPSAATVSHPTRFLAQRYVPFIQDEPPKYVLRINANGQIEDSVAIFSPLNTSVQMGVLVEGKEVYFHPRIESSVTADVRSGFWTFGRGTNRLEWHDSVGVARKLFGVRSTDEPDLIMNENDIAAAATQKRSVATPYMPSTRGLRLDQWLDVDRTGLLWITRVIPAPSYDTIALQTEYRAKYEAPGEGTIPLSVQDRRHHSTVDVIDPQLGVRLASLQLPFRAVRVSAGVVGRLTEDDDGYIVARAYTLTLADPRNRRSGSITP